MMTMIIMVMTRMMTQTVTRIIIVFSVMMVKVINCVGVNKPMYY